MGVGTGLDGGVGVRGQLGSKRACPLCSSKPGPLLGVWKPASRRAKRGKDLANLVLRRRQPKGCIGL